MIEDDFDEDTFETIEPITELRQKKKNERINNLVNQYMTKRYDKTTLERLQKELKQLNIFIVSRRIFNKTDNSMVEAWFTKFDQVFIDDSEKPYIPLYTKKEKAIHIAKKINKENFDKGLEMIHKTTDGISKFANSINLGSNQKRRKVRF